MAVTTAMSSSNGSKNVKQRGADPPGRSKKAGRNSENIDGVSPDGLSNNEPFAARRSKSRGRSLGRSTSSRGLHRTTSSRSLAKSRRSRSLAASKDNKSSDGNERSKSLGRGGRGRSKSRGRKNTATEDGRSKSRRRKSERGERSKSRGKVEQKRVQETKTSPHPDGNGDQLPKSDRVAQMEETSAKAAQSPPLSTSEKTPRARSGSSRHTSPSIQTLNAPLIPPIRNVESIPTLSQEAVNKLPVETNVSSEPPALHRGVRRSTSAQADTKTTIRSPKRSQSTDEIKISPRKNAANAPTLFFKETTTSDVPVNTLPRQRPCDSDALDKVTLSKDFQSTDDNPFLPKEAIDKVESNTAKFTHSSKVAMKDYSALPKSAYQPRDSPKTNAQTLVASASLFVTVLEGRMLVPMHRNMLGFKTHSHPYVEAYVDGKLLGKTLHAYRTVNPVWKSGNSVSTHYDGTTAKEKASRNEEIELRVYHLGKGSVSAFMGAVRVPLVTQGRAEWYPVQQRSALDSGLYCPNASGELKVQVNFTAHSYPELKPGHELPISGNAEISLNLSWSGDSSLETSCVALDGKHGHVLWKECVYFANRINLSNSVARPEVQDHNNDATRDSLLFDFGMVPENVAAFYVVLTIRDKSCTLSDIQSFQLTARNESTRGGIGRLSVNFATKDTSAILLRIARSTMGTVNAWKLATIVKGYKVFREFGSLLPQLQEFSSDILPAIGTPTTPTTERTALMRCGDSLQLLDYVPDHLPSKLVTGFFWKVKNKGPLKVAISLLDGELREVDAIHRTQPGSLMSQGVLYSGGNEEYEKFEIAFSQLSSDVHYICFVLGPCSRQKADDIENMACHIVNPALGTELARCTLSNFESVPTKSVGLGCFYKTGKGWSFTILGLCSTDTTFAGRLSELRTHIFENPLEPAISLPHPRLLKSVMPPAIPLPPPRQLAFSDTVEAYHNFHRGQNVCTSTQLTVRRQFQK